MDIGRSSRSQRLFCILSWWYIRRSFGLLESSLKALYTINLMNLLVLKCVLMGHFY